MAVYSNQIEDQLWKLSSVCERLKYNGFDLAKLVLFAVNRHISTGRATLEYLEKFVALSETEVEKMTEYCLKRDCTIDNITGNTKRFMKIRTDKEEII